MRRVRLVRSRPGKGTQTYGDPSYSDDERRDHIRRNVGELTKKMTPQQIAEGQKMSREINEQIEANKKAEANKKN